MVAGADPVWQLMPWSAKLFTTPSLAAAALAGSAEITQMLSTYT